MALYLMRWQVHYCHTSVESSHSYSSQEELKEYYHLYEQVYNRSFELNVHKLPFDYFKAMDSDPNYDVIQMYLNNADKPSTLVGVMFSHINHKTYNALIVGLDYNYVYKHNTYKQLLYQTLQRAKNLNCKKLDLAFTAELEKKKLGAQPVEVFAYVQSTEHFSHSLLDAI